MGDSNFSNFIMCCRLCLSKNLDFVKSILDDQSLQQKISTLVGVEVQQGDRFSTMICVTCVVIINRINEFKQSCLDNQSKLEQWLHFQDYHIEDDESTLSAQLSAIEEDIEFQKPNSLNASDQNKFGQKMLEKMGWSKGKGLGANLHGDTEHVHVSYKNDQNGIGYKARDDQWTEQQDSFNELLKNLSAGSGDTESEVKLKSLEEKSKVSKARVHYAKFTRGKDLSRASTKDLASIFGKKTLINYKEKQVEIKEESEEEQPKGESSFMRNGGNMFDYFKKKLPGFGKNVEGYVVGNNGVLKKDSDSEDEVKSGFGFNQNNKAGFGFVKSEASCENEQNGFANSAFDPFATKVDVKKHVLNPIEEQEEEGAEENKSYVEKKAKKSGRKRNSLETIEEVDGSKSEKLENNIEEDKTLKIKKKKKKNFEKSPDNKQDTSSEIKQFENPLCVQQLVTNGNGCQEETVENPYEVVRKDKKKKKKKSRAVGEVNQETIVNQESIEETEVVRNPFEVERKRNKRKRDDDSTPKTEKKAKLESSAVENPSFDTTANDSKNNNEFEVVRKKKKKRQVNLEISAVDNPTFELTCDNSKVNNNAFEVSRKKKKKTPLDNPTFTEDFEDSKVEVPKKNKNKTSVEEENCVDNNAFEIPRKKNKKKKTAIDNPTFTEEDCGDDSKDNNKFEVPRPVKNGMGDDEIEESDLMLNVTATPTPTTILKSSGSTTKKRRSVRFSAVNEERIIPNLDDIAAKNELFEINDQIIQTGIVERMEEYRRKVEEAQIQLENEMNQAKLEEEKYIGEIETTDGEAEKLPNGHCKLKFKDAKFNNTSFRYARQDATTKAKVAYKKRIRGDIILEFNNCNLHEIKGYATQPVRRKFTQ